MIKKFTTRLFVATALLAGLTTYATASEDEAYAHCEKVYKLDVGIWPTPQYSPALNSAQPFVAELLGLTAEQCVKVTLKNYGKVSIIYIALAKGEIDAFIGSSPVPFFYGDNAVADINPTITGWLNWQSSFTFGGAGTERKSVGDVLGKTMLFIRCTPIEGDFNYSETKVLPKFSIPDVLFRSRIERAKKEGELPADTQVICQLPGDDRVERPGENVIPIRKTTVGSAIRINEVCNDPNLLTAFLFDEEGTPCLGNDKQIVSYITPDELIKEPIKFPQDQLVSVYEALQKNLELKEAIRRYEKALVGATQALRKDPEPWLTALANKYPESPIGHAVTRGRMKDLVRVGLLMWPDRCPTAADFEEYVKVYELEGKEETLFSFMCED